MNGTQPFFILIISGRSRLDKTDVFVNGALELCRKCDNRGTDSARAREYQKRENWGQQISPINHSFPSNTAYLRLWLAANLCLARLPFCFDWYFQRLLCQQVVSRHCSESVDSYRPPARPPDKRVNSSRNSFSQFSPTQSNISWQQYKNHFEYNNTRIFNIIAKVVVMTRMQ